MRLGIILGCILILYFLIIASHTHLNNKFPIVWLILGFVSILLSCYREQFVTLWTNMPIQIQYIVITIILIIIIFILIMTGQILVQFVEIPPIDLTYLIVLGAQLKEKGPSLSLQRRLDRAIEYLKENENTCALVSGGKGKNEPMTEAEGMFQYMIANGISPNRIIKEDTSVNTFQNLIFCKAIIERKQCIEMKCKETKTDTINIGIVTSNFHMYRAKKIAKKNQYKLVYGLPAKTEIYMLPTAILREVIALIKDFLVGNL